MPLTTPLSPHLHAVLTPDTRDQIAACCVHQYPVWTGAVTIRLSLPKAESTGRLYHHEALLISRACDAVPLVLALIASHSAWAVAESDGWSGKAWATGVAQQTWDRTWDRASRTKAEAEAARPLQPVEPQTLVAELRRRCGHLTAHILAYPHPRSN